MGKGIVKWFDPKKGFGFLVNPEGEDVFVHYSNIEIDGFRCLRTGQEVVYEEFTSDKGLQGKKVRIVASDAKESEKADAKQSGQVEYNR